MERIRAGIEAPSLHDGPFSNLVSNRPPVDNGNGMRRHGGVGAGGGGGGAGVATTPAYNSSGSYQPPPRFVVHQSVAARMAAASTMPDNPFFGEGRERARNEYDAPVMVVDDGSSGCMMPPHNSMGDVSDRMMPPPGPPAQPSPHYTAAKRRQDALDTHAQEVEKRIMFVDGGILNDEALTRQRNEVKRYAYMLVDAVGLEYVRALYVHAHARVAHVRDGSLALTGAVLVVEGTATVARIPGDWGAACILVPLQPPSATANVLAGMERMKRRAHQTRDAQGESPTFIDESLTPVAAETGAVRDVPVPTLAYNGSVMIGEGYNEQEEQVNRYAVVCNHSPQAVQMARAHAKQHQWTVHDFYRSDAYRMCVTHGALQCALVAQVACDAVGIAARETIELVYDRPGPTAPDVRVRMAKPERYAPHTYIRPAFVHDVQNDSTIPVYEVHMGTYGEYQHAAMPRPLSVSVVAMAEELSTRRGARRAAKEHEQRIVASPTSNTHHGFVIQHGGTRGFVVYAHVHAREPHEQYWLLAFGKDAAQARVQLREHLPGMTAGMVYYPVHRGYPMCGTYLGHDHDRSVDAFEMREEDRKLVFFHGQVQPHLVSHHYLPLVSNRQQTPLGQKAVRLEQTLFPTHFSAQDDMLRIVARGNMRAMYVGGLNTHTVGVAHMVLTLSPTDHIRIPMANADTVRELHELAIKFHQHARTAHGKTPEELTSEISNGTIVIAHSESRGSFDYWYELTGGAVVYDNSYVVVDRMWLVYAVRHMASHVLPVLDANITAGV